MILFTFREASHDANPTPIKTINEPETKTYPINDLNEPIETICFNSKPFQKFLISIALLEDKESSVLCPCCKCKMKLPSIKTFIKQFKKMEIVDFTDWFSENYTPDHLIKFNHANIRTIEKYVQNHERELKLK